MLKPLHYLFLFLLLLPVASIANVFDGRPEWVEKHPAEKGYYVGIGMAKKSLGDAENAALRNAQSDIVRQIGTYVSVENGRNGTATTTSSNALISGWSHVNNWQNDDEYWVYIHLSRSDYQSRLEQSTRATQKNQAARDAATAHLNASIAASNAGEMTTALREAIAASIAYAPVAGTVSVIGAVDMSTAIPAQISALLSAITIAVPDPFFTGPRAALTTASSRITVTAYGKPVRNLPLLFTVATGSAHPLSVVTDQQGTALCRFDGTPAGSTLRLTVTPDIAALSGGNTAYCQKILAGYALPQGSLVFAFENEKSVCIIQDGTADGKPLVARPLIQKLRQLFIGRGFTCTNTPEAAHYVCRLEGEAQSAPSFSGMYFAKLTVALSLTDPSGNAIYASRTVGPLKAFSNSPAGACESAWNATAADSVTAAAEALLRELQ